MSCSLPLKANAEVRAITFRPGILASKFKISSASPSLKYSFSLSALMLAKGKTAMEGVLAVGAGVAVACSRAARTSFMVWKRLAGNLRMHRVTIAERFDGASSGAGSSRTIAAMVSTAEFFENALAATQHFIQHHAEGKNVGARVRRLALGLFRRHVRRRPQDRAHFREVQALCHGIGSSRGAGGSYLRQSEIQQLHAVRSHQNVGGFQIAMRDVFLVRGVQRIADLRGIADRSIKRERTLERSPVDKLHDQIIGPDVVNLTNIGMIQRGDGFGFPLEALRELRGGNFDGHLAIQARIFGAKHFTHAARANRRDDLVRAKLIASGKWHRGNPAKST